jgi:four helix bundle protein
MVYLDFTEMPVWQLAAEIVEEPYVLAAKLPRCEDYALRGQVREAALSRTGNIAEGFGHAHNKDKPNFNVYDRGSSYEVNSQLLTGHKVAYFTFGEISPMNTKCEKVFEELNKIIKSLLS